MGGSDMLSILRRDKLRRAVFQPSTLVEEANKRDTHNHPRSTSRRQIGYFGRIKVGLG